MLFCGVLAVSLIAVPSAQAQTTPDHPAYTLKTEPADLSAVQNGDPLRITLSGLPKGASAKLVICPKDVPDGLIKVATKEPWLAEHTLLTRVTSYCAGGFGDELTGRPAGMQLMTRKRSSTTGNIVFDTAIPRGSSQPRPVAWDPLYTTFDKAEKPEDKFPKVPWADNPVVSVDPVTGAKTRKRQFSYQCDDTSPCTIAVQITAQNPDKKTVTWIDESTKFTPFAPGLGVKGCKGIGQSSLNSSVPERFGRTMVSWNQALCAPTQSEQPANIVSETEDTGLTAFDKGESDIAVTGTGGALAAQTVRSRQYVPLGLNAVVVAAVGWAPTETSDDGAKLNSRVASTFSFGYDDVAGMLTKGGERPDEGGRAGIFRDGSALVGRNAAMAAVTGVNGQSAVARSGALDPATGFFGVTGESGKGTIPLALSQVLVKNAASSWVFREMPNDKYYGELNGKSPGVITDLGQLDPGEFRLHNVDAKIGQLSVRKTVDGVVIGNGAECATGGCLSWVLTDLATAKAYGWTPVALPDGKGASVAPTEQSLLAAAASMKAGDDGTLQTGTVTAAGAYPLTFAEYLTVPVNPLVDATCKPMTAKQAQLKAFADLAAGNGQGLLSPGMVPLSKDLKAVATERVAKIGTGTPEGACKEKEEAKNPPPPGSGGTGTGTPVANPSLNSPSGTTGSSAGAPAAAGTPAAAAAPTPASVQAAKLVADGVDIPKFAGAGVLGALIPLLALVALATLPSATAFFAAGRRKRPGGAA